MFLEKAILKKQELDALRPFKKEIEERVMQKLRIDWNYHSNSIEGNSLTYGETKSLLLHHITAQGKPLRDHFEITGHNEAINMVLDVVKGDRNITENFIRELHKLILKENYSKRAITSDGKETIKEIKIGVYKTEPNHVLTKTGEIFYFAEPFEVSSKMSDLIEWYNSEIQRKDFNPILLATEFHYKFVRIHPFDDGNGRLARILMNFILVKFGYHPAIIKKENKDRYFDVLRIADGNNINPFVEYVSECVFDSLDLMHKAVIGIKFEEEDDVDKQFWLLKEKLKGITIEKKRDGLSFEKVFESVVVPLFDTAIDKSNKFRELYFEYDKQVHYTLIGTENKKYRITDITDLKNKKILGISSITLIQKFTNLKIDSIIPVSYYSDVTIFFEESKYHIFIRDSKKPLLDLKKKYEIIIEKNDIITIISEMIKNHINYIDSITDKQDGRNRL